MEVRDAKWRSFAENIGVTPSGQNRFKEGQNNQLPLDLLPSAAARDPIKPLTPRHALIAERRQMTVYSLRGCDGAKTIQSAPLRARATVTWLPVDRRLQQPCTKQSRGWFARFDVIKRQVNDPFLWPRPERITKSWRTGSHVMRKWRHAKIACETRSTCWSAFWRNNSFRRQLFYVGSAFVVETLINEQLKRSSQWWGVTVHRFRSCTKLSPNSGFIRWTSRSTRTLVKQQPPPTARSYAQVSKKTRKRVSCSWFYKQDGHRSAKRGWRLELYNLDEAKVHAVTHLHQSTLWCDLHQERICRIRRLSAQPRRERLSL